MNSCLPLRYQYREGRGSSNGLFSGRQGSHSAHTQHVCDLSRTWQRLIHRQQVTPALSDQQKFSVYKTPLKRASI